MGEAWMRRKVDNKCQFDSSFQDTLLENLEAGNVVPSR
jgi:hypothetical protein